VKDFAKLRNPHAERKGDCDALQRMKNIIRRNSQIMREKNKKNSKKIIKMKLVPQLKGSKETF
jgi:hypothetical protein